MGLAGVRREFEDSAAAMRPLSGNKQEWNCLSLICSICLSARLAWELCTLLTSHLSTSTSNPQAKGLASFLPRCSISPHQISSCSTLIIHLLRRSLSSVLFPLLPFSAALFAPLQPLISPYYNSSSRIFPPSQRSSNPQYSNDPHDTNSTRTPLTMSTYEAEFYWCVVFKFSCEVEGELYVPSEIKP